MTHTSTEQPEALLIAKWLRESPSEAASWADIAAMHIERMHARVQELEASQAQRVTLDYHDIAMAHVHIGAHGQLPATERIVRWTEAANCITQEKQW